MKKRAFLGAVAALLFTSAIHAQAEPSAAVADRTARTIPAWARSGVIYQVWPRAFTAQGNLAGVVSRMDEMQKLDINVLWLMPVQPDGKLKSKGSLGSPYAIQDYLAIDPALGTAADLHALVAEAHRRHMKVILDFVANHTAWDSVMMAHPDWYKHDKAGNVTFPYDWSDVAALDYRNPALRKYMTDALLYWVKTFDIDGYRCDAAGEVPTSFWNEASAALRAAKPDLLMLAESEKPDLMATAFDLDYGWAGMHALNEVVMNGAPATATIHGSLEAQRRLFPRGTLHMRMTDDHDELRAIARYGYPGAIAAWTVAATLEGVPLIWNGMEVGDTTSSGAPALFEPQKIYWQAVDWHKDYPSYFSAVDHLRRDHTAFQTGDAHWVANSDEQHLVTYTRTDGHETYLVAVNLSNTPFRGTIEGNPTTADGTVSNAWTEVPLPGFAASAASLTANATATTTTKTAPNILPAFGVRIFRRSS